MVKQNKNMCDKLGIECVRIPPAIHNQPYLPRWPGENYNAPAVRNVNGVMYSLNTRGFDHNDILVLLDSDMFLVKKISIRQKLSDYDMISRQIHNRGTVPHIWQGILFMNMKTLPNIRTINFNCGRVDNLPVDAGGYTYYYIRDNPDIKIKYIEQLYSLDFRCTDCNRTKRYTCNHMRNELKNAGLDDAQAVYFEQSHNSQFFYDRHFLHYRSGTNWEHRDNTYIQQKTNALHTYLNTILQ